jgi:hypothetical protein
VARTDRDFDAFAPQRGGVTREVRAASGDTIIEGDTKRIVLYGNTRNRSPWGKAGGVTPSTG